MLPLRAWGVLPPPSSSAVFLRRLSKDLDRAGNAKLCHRAPRRNACEHDTRGDEVVPVRVAELGRGVVLGEEGTAGPSPLFHKALKATCRPSHASSTAKASSAMTSRQNALVQVSSKPIRGSAWISLGTTRAASISPSTASLTKASRRSRQRRWRPSVL